MITKSQLTRLTLALAVLGGSVFVSISAASAQHYVDYPYWVETEYCPGPACDYPYPPFEPCYYRPPTVIVIPADCPPGSVCHISYFDSSTEERKSRAQGDPPQYDSTQREGQNRKVPREIQDERSQGFESQRTIAARPEIELEYPSQRWADNPNEGGLDMRSAKSFEPDMDLPPQDGWEFDNSSSKD